ncbi:MAG: hypothetical protein V1493_05880, partial [Candidatus Diapherotrites archaeon]
ICLAGSNNEGTLFGALQLIRVIPFISVFMAASAGIFFERIFSLAGKNKGKEMIANALAFCLVISLVFYFNWNAIDGQDSIPVESSYDAITSIRQAAAWIGENTGPSEIIANEYYWGGFGAYGGAHILDHYIPLLAQRKVIGGNLNEGSKTTFTINYVPQRLDSETPARLRSLGASFIATCSDEIGRTLEQNSAYKKEFQDGSVRIFRIAKADSAETTAAFTDFSEEKGKIFFETDLPFEKTITLPVNYYPNWNAEINGQKAGIGISQDNLMVLKLPAGKNSVALEFREMLYEKILLVVSLLATAYFLLFFFPELQAKAFGLFRKARNSK